MASLPFAVYLLVFVPLRYNAFFEPSPAVIYHADTDLIAQVEAYRTMPRFWRWKYFIPFVGNEWVAPDRLALETYRELGTLKERIARSRMSYEERMQEISSFLDSGGAEAQRAVAGVDTLRGRLLLGYYPRLDLEARELLPPEWEQALTDADRSRIPMQAVDLVVQEQTLIVGPGKIEPMYGERELLEGALIVQGREAAGTLRRLGFIP